MQVAKIRLRQEPYKSFIVHNEKDPFTPWHHHPEYELVLIVKGKGKRLVGDHVARFEKNDLVFLGPFLPHQWVCEIENMDESRGPFDEAFVIQFGYDFLGDKFFEIPENSCLKRFLIESNRGYEFLGKTKERIISILHDMFDMSDVQRLYALLRIFEIFASTKEYDILASPTNANSFHLKDDNPMKKAMQYILQNFQDNIQIQDLLDLTNLTYASFYPAFKKAYTMSFKDYLLSVRVGYACKLLTEGSMQISEIAYDAGFENLSNFNRQFKKIKGITPSQFQKQYRFENIPVH
jgi:AraC-like DNA-binding protein